MVLCANRLLKKLIYKGWEANARLLLLKSTRSYPHGQQKQLYMMIVSEDH